MIIFNITNGKKLTKVEQFLFDLYKMKKSKSEINANGIGGTMQLQNHQGKLI